MTIASAEPRDADPASPQTTGLNQSVPAHVRQRLADSGQDAADIVLSIPTDIDLLGRGNAEWVIANSQTLWVVNEADQAPPRIVLPMSQIREFRTVAAVGSGLLQARTDGVWTDLVRYSNTVKYWFNRLAKRLDQLRQGEVIEFEDEDRHDPRRCQQCGLMLQFAGETCPRCVSPGAAISRVLQMMKPHWKWAAVMMGLLLLGICLAQV